MMHDYMALIGNSSRACDARKKKHFLRMVIVNSARVVAVAAVVILTTK